jgi:hypothetical protein|tara:strand:- start:375 stop:932 length:558 start_codon:yes stop_codon:yes gene_type:complete
MLNKTKSAVTDLYSWMSDGVKNHIKILKLNPKRYHEYLWLKLCIYKDEIYMRVFGSKTNYELCVRRWEWLLTVRMKEVKNRMPDDQSSNPKKFTDWIYEYGNVIAEAHIASREADHHRSGCGLSWSKSDMSDENIAEYPEWWFNINKFKLFDRRQRIGEAKARKQLVAKWKREGLKEGVDFHVSK